MGLVPYLHGGETASAEKMNKLFEELDNRIAQAMRNLNLVFLTHKGNFLRLAGTLYYFHDGNPTYSLLYGDSDGQDGKSTYNHSTYSNYAAAMIAIDQDDESKIALCTPTISSPFLLTSLEAHTIDIDGIPYRILEDSGVDLQFLKSDSAANNFDVQTNYSPEKIFTDAMAEIVIENLSELSFPHNYNKFNRFRFNNLSKTACAISFKNSEDEVVHSLSIPPGESRCVRRKSVTEGYLNGFRYFQKFIHGDKRFYSRGTLRNYKRPYESGSACNLSNPSILFEYLLAFRDGSPRFHIDQTVVADMTREYKDLFPCVELDSLTESYKVNLSSKIVDGMLHKGKLNLATLDLEDEKLKPSQNFIEYDGIGNLVSKFAEKEITAIVGDNEIALDTPPSDSSKSRDLIPKTTNLFAKHQWLGSFNAMAGNLVEGYSDGAVLHYLNRPQHELWLYAKRQESVEQDGASYTDLILQRVDPSASELVPPKPIRVTKDTISDLKNLSFFGSNGAGPGSGYVPELIPADNNTDFQQFTDRAVVISPRGLTLTFKETLSPGACSLAFFDTDETARNAGFSLDGLKYYGENGDLKKTHSVVANDGDFGERGVDWIFLTPRHVRLYAPNKSLTMELNGVEGGTLINPDYSLWEYSNVEYKFNLTEVQSTEIAFARKARIEIPSVYLKDVPGVGDITVYPKNQAPTFIATSGAYDFFKNGELEIGKIIVNLDGADQIIDAPAIDDAMVRPVLGAETFNLMAEAVNQITGVYPISITDRIFRYPAELDVANKNLIVGDSPALAYDANGKAWMFLLFSPSPRGLGDSDYAPVDFFHQPAAAERWVMGTCKTSSDLPASYWSCINTAVKLWRFEQDFTATVTASEQISMPGETQNNYELTYEPDGDYRLESENGTVDETGEPMNLWEVSGFGGEELGVVTPEQARQVGFDRFAGLKWITWEMVKELDTRFGVFNSILIQRGTIQIFDISAEDVTGEFTFADLVGSGFQVGPNETPPDLLNVGDTFTVIARAYPFTRHITIPPPPGPNFYDHFNSYDQFGAPCVRKNYAAFVADPENLNGDWWRYPENNMVVNATPLKLCASFDLHLQTDPLVPEYRIEQLAGIGSSNGTAVLFNSGDGTGSFEFPHSTLLRNATGVHATMERNIYDLLALGFGSEPERIDLPLVGWIYHPGGGCAPGTAVVGSGERQYIVSAPIPLA